MIFLLWLFLSALCIGVPILLIVYIVRTNTLTKKVEQLERNVEHLAFGPQQSKSETARPSTEEAKPPIPATKVAPEQLRAKPVPVSTAAPQPPVFSPPPTKPSRTREEWESLIGGKLLNRIGAVALIIGMGFFLKYAIDKDWVTETTRVLIGVVAGSGLLLFGARSNRKGFGIFAQGLVGAGIAILYLSVYASFNFYSLVPQVVAFILMSAVTVVTLQQAFKYDSLAVALLGWLGGFLTPFMLSTGEANEVGLFTYIALLDIGLIAIVLRKNAWIVLEPLTFGATVFTFLLWYDAYYTPEDLWLTVAFAIIFWGIFFLLDVIRSLRRSEGYPELRHLIGAVNGAFYYLILYQLINPVHPGWMGLTTLLFGLMYFGSYLAMKSRASAAMGTTIRYTLTSIGLLVIATAVEFRSVTTVIWWSVEALALLWAGKRWGMNFVTWAGFWVLILASARLLTIDGALVFDQSDGFVVLLNRRALAFLVLAASAGAGTMFIRVNGDTASARMRSALHYLWCLALLVLVTVETIDFFETLLPDTDRLTDTATRFSRFMTLAGIWMGYSLVMVWLGLSKRLRPALVTGLCAIVLAVTVGGVRGMAFDPIESFRFALNYRALMLVWVIVGMSLQLRWLKGQVHTHKWLRDVVSIMQVTMVLMVLALLTAEMKDLFQNQIAFARQETYEMVDATEIARLRDLQQLSLSGVWLLYSILLMVVGIMKRVRGLRIISIGLFGVTILKIFIYDLSFLDTLYRIFSFIGLGVILLIVSYLYQRYKSLILETPPAGS